MWRHRRISTFAWSKLRRQRIVGDYNRRFEKKLLDMPDRCVVYGCSNKADPENGIGLHKIPFFGDDRKECRRRRKKWIDFVLRRRAHWKPTKHSKICSLHFRREDFSRMFTALPEQEKLSAPRLMADDVGPCVFPAIQTNDPEFGQIDRSPPMSERTRRMVIEYNSGNPERIWNCFACVTSE